MLHVGQIFCRPFEKITIHNSSVVLVVSEFVEARVQVCSRLCNKVTDALAAFGCNCPSDDQITWGDVPRFVENLVTSDLAESNE
jgi:hypothetical protein